MADDALRFLFRNRQRWIEAADTAVTGAARAAGLIKTAANKREIRIAARRSEQAANFYRRAGLGLLAKKHFAAAASFYSLCRDHERTKLNQDRHAAVSTYWGEEETS
jgi:hypothetical protein